MKNQKPVTNINVLWGKVKTQALLHFLKSKKLITSINKTQHLT
jgi:hypothetical protein